MVSRGTSQTNLKMMMAMGGGALFLLLALVGGVVGWFSRDTPEQVGPPQVGKVGGGTVGKHIAPISSQGTTP